MSKIFHYNQQTLDYFQQAKHAGELNVNDEQVVTASIGTKELGSVIKLYVKLDEAKQTILDARFKAYGCVATIAVCQLACQELLKKSLQQINYLTAEFFMQQLELPTVKLEKCQLVAKAIAKLKTA